jgi:general secretion pathway protein N
MKAANQRRLTPVLVGAAIALAALWLLLLMGVGRGERWDAPHATTPLPPATAATDLPRAQPLQQFAAVWQKPLFNPDRKPIIRAADGSSPGDLELTGVIITPTLRMALLHDKTADRQLRLREGASLPDGSVTLVELHPRSALVDSSGGRVELKLPAGAPIDMPKAGPDDGHNGPGEAMMRVDAPVNPADRAARRSGDGRGTIAPQPSSMQPGAPVNRPSPASLDRLRKIIQKRRAEQAAANEGVR